MTDHIGNVAITSHLTYITAELILIFQKLSNIENALTPVAAPLIKRIFPSGITIASIINLLPGIVSTSHPAAMPAGVSFMRAHWFDAGI